MVNNKCLEHCTSLRIIGGVCTSRIKVTRPEGWAAPKQTSCYKWSYKIRQAACFELKLQEGAVRSVYAIKGAARFNTTCRIYNGYCK